MIASPRVDAAHLYDRLGPFVTIYIPAPSAMRGATDLLALRWKSLRRVLARRGAAGRDLAALDGAVAEGHTGGETLVAVAAQGEVLLHEMTSVDVARSIGFCEALPILTPLMAWQQGVTRQLLVATDRIGADLTVIVGTMPVREAEIEGETEQVHKPHAGGLSQKRYRAAPSTRGTGTPRRCRRGRRPRGRARRVDRPSGGRRACARIPRSSPPPRVRALVHRVHGAIDPSSEEVRRAATSLVATHTTELLQEFAERRARRDRSVEGARPRRARCSAGRVETLLVHASFKDRRRAAFGDDPTPVAAVADAAGGADAEKLRVAPLAEVAVRAALGTSAAVWFIPRHSPNGPTGGVGALTRFDAR